MEVSFDPNLMDPEEVTFYSFLGGPEDSFQDFDSTTPGILSFGQTSLLLDSDLKSLQPASFLLATLTFKALGEGGAELNFSYTDLVERFDQDGIPVSFPPEEIAKIPANVVIQPATNIPEPGTLMLMVSGLAFCFARRINRKTVNSK